MKRLLLIALNEGRLIMADPFPVLLLIGMPALLLTFVANGFVGGSVRSVPGLLMLFGFFGPSVVGISFFREHGWNTWDRFRASPAHPLEVIAGKALPFVVLFIMQHVILLSFGKLWFAMPWRGTLIEATGVIGSVVTVEVTFGILLVTLCRTINQVNALGNLGGLLFAGLGGALTPVSDLPMWVQWLAPASPVYWAIKGFEVLVGAGGGQRSVTWPVTVLMAFATFATVFSLWQYRFDQHKTFYGAP